MTDCRDPGATTSGTGGCRVGFYCNSDRTCRATPSTTSSTGALVASCVPEGGACVINAACCAGLSCSNKTQTCVTVGTTTTPTPTPKTTPKPTPTPTPINKCSQGNTYCKTDILYTCKADKSGYTNKSCGPNSTSTVGQNSEGSSSLLGKIDIVKQVSAVYEIW